MHETNKEGESEASCNNSVALGTDRTERSRHSGGTHDKLVERSEPWVIPQRPVQLAAHLAPLELALLFQPTLELLSLESRIDAAHSQHRPLFRSEELRCRRLQAAHGTVRQSGRVGKAGHSAALRGVRACMVRR